MISLLDNVVEWLRLDDDTADTVVLAAYGANGTAQRNTNLMHTAGKVGGAFLFDGTNDHVEINSSFDWVFIDLFTISIDVKPSDGRPSSTQYFFGVRHFVVPEDDGDAFIYLRLNTNGSVTFAWKGEYAATVYSVTTSVLFADGAASTYTQLIVVASYLPVWIETGEDEGYYENQIVFKIYADGTLVGSNYTGLANIDDWHNTHNLLVGAYNEQQSYGVTPVISGRFIGALDNFMVFDKAFSAAERAELKLLAFNGGYHRVYRGQDGNIDYDNAVALMALDAADITIPAQSLPPNTIWHYARKQVSDCGLESSASPVCIVAINDAGDMVSNTPNVPQNLVIEPLVGAKFMLRWRYLSTGQEIVPTSFRIYMDSGTGFDFNTPLATVDYRKAIEHKWTSDALTHGQRYKFIVRSYNSVSLGESQNTGFVSALADSVGPPAAAGLAISWESQ